MQLTTFISDLLNDGKVTVEGTIQPFKDDDLKQTAKILKQYHKEDRLEVPGSAPAFFEDAALWAAKYFYLAVQLTVLRDADETMIKKELQPFEGKITPEVVYSADLILRYLPQLFELVKGLAPGDVLVQHLQQTAKQWPLSSVGIEIDGEVNNDVLFEHASLYRMYIDRIIKYQDLSKAANEKNRSAIGEALGGYATTLWPEFEKRTENTINENY